MIRALALDEDVRRSGRRHHGAAPRHQHPLLGAHHDPAALSLGDVALRGLQGRPAGRAGTAEGDAAHAVEEQDAHALVGGRPDRGPRVVVGQDLVVRKPVLGVAIGAVLAHADPVSEAGSLDDPDLGRGGGRPRGRRRAQAGSDGSPGASP